MGPVRRTSLPQLVGLLVTSYLAGAFPTAELVTKSLGRDVHREGSGNPGATNTYRIAGARAAALVAAVDIAKGALTTLAGQQLARPGNKGRGAACGVAAVLGHCFPPRNPTDGGKGVATTGGMLLVLDPPLGVAASVAWAVLAKATRRPSLASITVAASLPMAAIVLRRPASERAALAAVAAIILARHRDNIARLRTGLDPPTDGPPTSGPP